MQVRPCFFITKGKKQLTVEEITENLCYLLNSTTPSSLVASTSLATNCKSLIGKKNFHRWKDMDGKKKWSSAWFSSWYK